MNCSEYASVARLSSSTAVNPLSVQPCGRRRRLVIRHYQRTPERSPLRYASRRGATDLQPFREARVAVRVGAHRAPRLSGARALRPAASAPAVDRVRASVEQPARPAASVRRPSVTGVTTPAGQRTSSWRLWKAMWAARTSIAGRSSLHHTDGCAVCCTGALHGIERWCTASRSGILPLRQRNSQPVPWIAPQLLERTHVPSSCARIPSQPHRRCRR